MGPGTLSRIARVDVHDGEVGDTARRQCGQLLAHLGLTAHYCEISRTPHTLAIEHRPIRRHLGIEADLVLGCLTSRIGLVRDGDGQTCDDQDDPSATR